MSEPIRSGATVAKNARVQSCPMCGGCGWLTRAYARVGEFGRVDCVLCSGTGRVVGVPKGSIVVADDTRVLVVPKMAAAAAAQELSEWGSGTRIRRCLDGDETVGGDANILRAAAVNLALDSAPQEEAPDADE